MISEIEIRESNANDVVVDEENQNSLDTIDEDSQLNAVRDLIIELKDMYNEFLLQIKLVQKDLIRSAKYDELESRVSSSIFFTFFFTFTYKYFFYSVTVYKYNAGVANVTKRASTT